MECFDIADDCPAIPIGACPGLPDCGVGLTCVSIPAYLPPGDYTCSTTLGDYPYKCYGVNYDSFYDDYLFTACTSGPGSGISQTLIPGDLDFDGDMDGSDYNILVNSVKPGVSQLGNIADLNNDNFVNAVDIARFRDLYNP